MEAAIRGSGKGRVVTHRPSFLAYQHVEQRLPIPGDHDHTVAAMVITVIAIGVGLGLVYGLIGALT